MRTINANTELNEFEQPKWIVISLQIVHDTFVEAQQQMISLITEQSTMRVEFADVVPYITPQNEVKALMHVQAFIRRYV